LDDSDDEELRRIRQSPRFHLSTHIRSEEEIEQAQIAADLENRVLHPDPSLDKWIKQTALAMAKTPEFQKHFQAQLQQNPPPVVIPALPSSTTSSSSSGSSSSSTSSSSSASSSGSSSSSSVTRSAQAATSSSAVHHEEESEGIIDRILNWLRVRLFGGAEVENPIEPAQEEASNNTSASTANLEISVIVTLAAMMIVAFAFVRK